MAVSSRPIQLIVGGRADQLDGGLSVADLTAGLRADLALLLPDAAADAFDVEVRLNPPSAELAHLVAGAGDGGTPHANDTSAAVVSLPRSPVEEAVYRIERHLTSDAVRRWLPIGPDLKVMGVRTGERARITVAAAVLAGKVSDMDMYEEAVRTVAREAAASAAQVLGLDAAVEVNAADGQHPYLTLCGSSAEAGDDGQVGRGNRFGGLITPCRPASLEACAGKNPVAHVGKTYHAMARDIAAGVLTGTDAREVTVTLVSRIGSPVNRPQLAHVAVCGEADRAVVERHVEARLSDWRGVRDRPLAGHYVLF